MRIILRSLTILATAILTIGAAGQSGMPKIPQDAFFVSRISGSSLQSKMSIKDMDKLPVFKEMFKNDMGRSEIQSFKDMGLDFMQDAYIWAEQTDSVTYLTWTLPIEDIGKFKKTFFSEMRISMDATPPHVDSDILMHWTDNLAIFSGAFVRDSYVSEHSDRIREQYDLSDAEQTEQEDFYGYEESDVIEIIEDEEQEVIDAARDAVEAVEEATDSAVKDVEEIYEEENEIVDTEAIDDEYSSGYDEDVYAEPSYEDYYGDSYGYNSLSYMEQRLLTEQWQRTHIAQILSSVSKSGNILSGKNHAKVAGSNADASAYLDYGAYTEMLLGEFSPYSYGMMGGMYSSMFTNMLNTTHGNFMFTELDFGKDAITWDLKYHAQGKSAEMQRNIFDSKMSKEYLNYMNSADLIGYYSMNINTKAMLETYSELMSYYLGGAAENAEVGEVMDEMMRLVIDEEAIARLIPGSTVITFSDISKRMIEYTTYDYDENWNRTEVTKEKEEVIPTFLAMMETHKPVLVEKLLNLSTMEEEMVKTDFGYQLNDGLFPIYFFVKGDMFFIGNDIAQVKAIKEGRFKAGLSAVHKKAILENNSVMFFDSKELIEDLEVEFTSGEIAEMIEFAKGKADKIMVTSGLEGRNDSFMKAVIDVPKGEANGWAFMMHLINGFYEFDQQH